MSNNSQELQELRKHIDAIITAAKLLEYKIETNKKDFTTTIISPKVTIDITLFRFPQRTINMKTSVNDECQVLTGRPIEVKLDHLNKILQKL